MMDELDVVIGGKGDESPPPAYVPVEDPNSLRSKAVYRAIDLLCEGEIEGLVDGHKSIFLNDVPLQAADDSYNFAGVTIHSRVGTPDQAPIPGFPDVVTPIGVGVELQSGSTVTKQITDANVSAATVLISLASLYEQKDNGDMTGSSVSFTIQVDSETLLEKTLTGKCVSIYQATYRLDLPDTGGPWDIKVTRTTPDSTSLKLQNKITWSSYAELIEHKMIYPDSAYIGFEADAEMFGGTVPKRSYLLRGTKVQIPTGYTPPYKNSEGIWQAAVYPGTFDGTLQSPQYTSNPAWCYYDLIRDSRYGAGLVDNGNALLWALYPISQYCDELIDDGFGGVEPRFTLNCLLNTQQEAYAVLATLTSAFRGMSWWGPGVVTASQDAPADPQILASPANVVNGLFTYEGTALKTRHTAAMVTWNNPDNHDLPEIELVIDEAGIAQYGYKPVDVAPVGCRSRGLAHRIGKWIIDSEKNETETVTYTAGLDHAFATPGMIVAIADPYVANIRLDGRLVSATGTALVLDKEIVLEIGETYSIYCILPDGSLDSRDITTTPDDGGHSAITVATAFTTDPQDQSEWIVASSAVAPRLFRVMSVIENEDGTYDVSALYHDATKYARVEAGIQLETETFIAEGSTGPVLPPNNAKIQADTYLDTDTLKQLLIFSWEAAADDRVSSYYAEYSTGDDFWTQIQVTQGFMVEKSNAQVGTYTFRVRSVTSTGANSEWVTESYTVTDIQAPPRVAGLELFDSANSEEFTGNHAVFVWSASSLNQSFEFGEEPYGADSGALDFFFKDYEVRILTEDNILLRTEHISDNTYTYTYEKNATDYQIANGAPGAHRTFIIEVYQRNNLNLISLLPARLRATNPSPGQLSGVELQAFFKSLFIGYTPSNDLDFAGVDVWMDTATDFTPDSTTLVYSGPDTDIFLTKLTNGNPLLPNTTYYVVMAGFDGFGHTGLTLSAELSTTTMAIVEGDLDDLAVTAQKIDDLAVTAQKIDDLAVGTTKIDALAVTAAKIGALAVTEAKIDALAVTAAKIGALAVTEAKINALAVTEAKIANLAVSNAKIAALAVDSAKIALLAVGEAHIQDLAVTSAKIGSLEAEKVNAGELRGIGVAAGSLYTAGSYLTAACLSSQSEIFLRNTTDFLSGGGNAVAYGLTNDMDAFSYTGKTATSLTGCDPLAFDAGTLIIPWQLAVMAIHGGTNELRFKDADGYNPSLTLGKITVGSDYFLGYFAGDSATRGIYASTNMASGMAIFAKATAVGAEGVSASSTNTTGNGMGVEAYSYGDVGLGMFAASYWGGNGNTTYGILATTSSQGGGISVRGSNSNSTIYSAVYGVYGDVGAASGFDFYAGGAGTNYGPFTGGHQGLVSKDFTGSVGDIVSDIRVVNKSNISNCICEQNLAQKPKDKTARGVLSSEPLPLDFNHPPSALMDKDFISADPTYLGTPVIQTSEDWYESFETLAEQYDLINFNAVGEGQVNICSEGGDVEIGDKICTSSMPGKGMRLDIQSFADMLCIVAESRENVCWVDEPETVKMIACIYHKG